MGQYWEVLNIDRKESGLSDCTTFNGLIFNDKMGARLYLALQMPSLPLDVDVWLTLGTFVPQPGPIGNLSAEVLDMIFAAITSNPEQEPTNLLDCIFFAVTCKRLLAAAKPHILRALVSRYSRAAHCRIVCLGACADMDDYAPPGMLTADEAKEIESAGEPLFSFALRHYTPYRTVVRTLHQPVQDLLWELEVCNARPAPAPPENLNPDPPLPRALELNMITTLARVAAAPGPNVLCNVTKGE